MFTVLVNMGDALVYRKPDGGFTFAQSRAAVFETEAAAQVVCEVLMNLYGDAVVEPYDLDLQGAVWQQGG